LEALNSRVWLVSTCRAVDGVATALGTVAARGAILFVGMHGAGGTVISGLTNAGRRGQSKAHAVRSGGTLRTLRLGRELFFVGVRAQRASRRFEGVPGTVMAFGTDGLFEEMLPIAEIARIADFYVFRHLHIFRSLVKAVAKTDQ